MNFISDFTSLGSSFYLRTNLTNKAKIRIPLKSPLMDEILIQRTKFDRILIREFLQQTKLDDHQKKGIPNRVNQYGEKVTSCEFAGREFCSHRNSVLAMFRTMAESRKRSKISCEEYTVTFDETDEYGQHMVIAHGKDIVPPVCPTDILNSYITSQHLTSAGLSIFDSNILFMRQEACQLLGNLQECEDQKSLLIHGPPGSGKSSVVWLWACLMAETSDILWIHLGPFGFNSCARLCHGKLHAFTVSFSKIEDIIETCKCHSIILDGITKEKMELLGTAWVGIHRLPNIGGPCVVSVASTQIIMGVEHLVQHKIEVLSMDSWTLDQYEQCCEDDNFYQQVEPMLGEGEEKEEKIINKYHYAGGSARWMFDFDVNRICCYIEKLISKCNDFMQLIEDSSVPSWNVAVNYLRQKWGKNHFIISNYVMRELVQKCDRTFIRPLTWAP